MRTLQDVAAWRDAVYRSLASEPCWPYSPASPISAASPPHPHGRRRDCRESVSLEYLKNVVLSGFYTGQLPPTSPLVPVLAKLLQFSPQESRQIAAKAAQASQAYRLLPGF